MKKVVVGRGIGKKVLLPFRISVERLPLRSKIGKASRGKDMSTVDASASAMAWSRIEGFLVHVAAFLAFESGSSPECV